jgi:hypothetical protein
MPNTRTVKLGRFNARAGRSGESSSDLGFEREITGTERQAIQVQL